MTDETETTPTEPPEGCTCVWTRTDKFGSVHIADDDCPARPHPRSWRAANADEPTLVNIVREGDAPTPPDDEHLQPLPDPTGRGFVHLPTIPSQYGGLAQVYESSAASRPHLWLRVQSPVDMNNPTGPMVEGIAHLTLEDAVRLAEQILWLAENHYQGEFP